jgi:hypothetical protein
MIMKYENNAFFIFMIVFILLMSVKATTWKEPQKARGLKVGFIQTQKGHIFTKKVDTINYINAGGRQWPTYCPLIQKRPKSWGTYLR